MKLGQGLYTGTHVMGPAEVPRENPCPFGFPAIGTVGHSWVETIGSVHRMYVPVTARLPRRGGDG